MKKKLSLNLTTILVEEPNDVGFTAFFAQFPNIIASGDTQDEAEKNLFILASDVFKEQAQDEVKKAKEIGIAKVTTKLHNLAAA